jgi:hypothetical protein
MMHAQLDLIAALASECVLQPALASLRAEPTAAWIARSVPAFAMA